jgi:polysaccharide pyruvyl transferase WcaK-like protein
VPAPEVRRVAVIDLWTDTNRGDEALQRSLVALLRERYPGVHVTGVFRFGTNELAAARPEIASTAAAVDAVEGGLRRTYYAEPNAGRYTGIAHQAMSVWSFVEALLCMLCFAALGGRAGRVIGDDRLRSLAAVRDADVVVWKGKNFRDYAGVTAVTRALTLGGAGWFAGRLNRRLHCVNASVWPVRHPVTRAVYRAAFRRCRSLTVREPSSAANAADLLGDRLPVAVCPDLSFHLLATAGEGAAVERDRDVALTVTSWGDAGARRAYTDAVVAAAVRLASAGAATFVVVPQVTRAAEDNTALVAALVRRLEAEAGVAVEVLDGPLSIDELLDTYRRCRFLLGARMHSCVFARSVGTPFVALSYDSGPKWEVLAGFWPERFLLEYGSAPAVVADACAEAYRDGAALVTASEAAWRAGVAGVAANLDGLDG